VLQAQSLEQGYAWPHTLRHELVLKGGDGVHRRPLSPQIVQRSVDKQPMRAFTEAGQNSLTN
jgi:hypothetical protein